MGDFYEVVHGSFVVHEGDHFKAKMGPTCRKSQMALRITYNEMTKSIAVKKRKRSKKDF